MALSDPGPTAPVLPQLDPIAVDQARAFAGHFADCDASVRVERDPARYWLSGPNLACAVVTLDGGAFPLHPERVEALAGLIDRLSPLFDRIEARCGFAVEFDRCVSLPDDTLAVRLTIADLGAVIDVVPAAATVARALPTNVPILSVGIQVAAARLPIDAAAGIARGDVLMLPPAPWPASLVRLLTDGGTETLAGTLDPSNGHWRGGGHHLSERKDPLSSDPQRPDIAGFMVPVTLHLPDVALDAAALADLGPGATVDLGPIGTGVEVELRIAGRPVARGELARVGDRHAVVIGDVAGSPAAAAEQPADED